MPNGEGFYRQPMAGDSGWSDVRMPMLLLFVAVFVAGGPASAGQPLVVDNAHLRLEIEPEHGVIARISDKQGRTDMAAAGGLADNFRLVLRTADKKSRTILGRNQPLSNASAVDGGLDLTWAGPLTDTEGGTHRLPVRMEIRLSETTLQFRLFLENQTPHRVAEAWYPVVGGLAGFAADSGPDETFVMLPAASPSIRKVALPFGEMILAYPAPGQLNMSFSSVHNTQANRALYLASHDPVARLKYYRYFEQSAPAGKDVFACIQHVPFAPPGQRFEGSPVVLRFHDGTWEAAGPLYREWFTRTFGLMDPSRSWIRRQSFIQDTMFLLPEGTLNYTFQDLPGWARAARDHGVTGVLVSGWHRGGHDNGYPHYEPDPRLGTYEDLKRALEACHQLGVRVYFFVNYQPAMIESEWYQRELHRYVEMREDGDYGTCGWGMGTLWARLGHPKPMMWIDPSFPEYREALLRQFLKLVEVGADGLHVDKMFPNAMNFNPRCELGPDTSPYEGPIRLTRTLLAEARKRNPDFALSFECNWDRMLEFGNAIWWVGNMSLARNVFPEMVETRAITSPYDYLGVNNAVRSSQVGLLGPLNYSRSIGWEPWQGLAQYLGEVKRIQDGLSEAVFFGDNLGRGQVEFGREPAVGVEYNVFRSLKTGQRVCILTNSGMERQRQTIQGFAPPSRRHGAHPHSLHSSPRCAAAGRGARPRGTDRVCRGIAGRRQTDRAGSAAALHRRAINCPLATLGNDESDREWEFRIRGSCRLDRRPELAGGSEHVRRVPGLGGEGVCLERRAGRGRDRPLAVPAVRAGPRRCAPADRRLERRARREPHLELRDPPRSRRHGTRSPQCPQQPDLCPGAARRVRPQGRAGLCGGGRRRRPEGLFDVLHRRCPDRLAPAGPQPTPGTAAAV
jgi:hypothetical protein